MKLSIVTISLVCDSELRSTVKSVRGLLHEFRENSWELEHVLISPDPECLSYANEYTKYIYREAGGIYDAMNTGLNNLNGDFVIFINGGDQLISLLSFFDLYSSNHSFDIYGFAVREDSAVGAVRVPRYTAPHPGTIYRVHFLSDFVFDINLKISADRDLFDTLRESCARIIFSKIAISIFNTDGVSSKRRDFRDRFNDAVYELRNRPLSFLRLWRFCRTVLG